MKLFFITSAGLWRIGMPADTLRGGIVIFKLKELIHSRNILPITERLLQIDKTSIAPMYQGDAHRWILTLCQSLTRYQRHLKNAQMNAETTSFFESQQALLQQAQSSLINNAVSLAQILSDEAKAALFQQRSP